MDPQKGKPQKLSPFYFALPWHIFDGKKKLYPSLKTLQELVHFLVLYVHLVLEFFRQNWQSKVFPPAAKFQSKYFSSGKLFAQQQPRHDIKIIENYWKIFAQQQRQHDIEIIGKY